MNNFWQNLNKPFTVLAPMDDVTDSVFRQIVCMVAKPDVFFTEFTNCEALSSKGRDSQIRRLSYTKDQHPIVAQIWGSNPKNFYKAAQLVKELNFDGVDINMSCPANAVIKTGTCGALINNRPLAKEIIHAVKDGSGDIPVSVKARIGFNTIQTEDWIGFILEQSIQALTIHGRTVKEQSKVPAHWEEIEKAVKLRNKINPQTIIIGNGDVKSYEDALDKHQKYGVDGIMIGRGVFNNIKVFDKQIPSTVCSKSEKIKLLKSHLELFESTWKGKKNYEIMKKFFKIYINDFDDAHRIRNELMQTKNYTQSLNILNTIQDL